MGQTLGLADDKRAYTLSDRSTAGKVFAAFMVTPETQTVIETFGADKYGQPLFVPIVGQREEEVGG